MRIPTQTPDTHPVTAPSPSCHARRQLAGIHPHPHNFLPENAFEAPENPKRDPTHPATMPSFRPPRPPPDTPTTWPPDAGLPSCHSRRFLAGIHPHAQNFLPENAFEAPENPKRDPTHPATMPSFRPPRPPPATPTTWTPDAVRIPTQTPDTHPVTAPPPLSCPPVSPLSCPKLALDGFYRGSLIGNPSSSLTSRGHGRTRPSPPHPTT